MEIKLYSTTRQYSSRFIFAMIMIGVGFIFLGIVLFMSLTSSEASPQEYTATPVKVNYPAPDLKLNDLQGNLVSIKDYLGKVILVNMWATWCPPCKAEMPTLESFYKKYKDNEFMIVGINDGEAPHEVASFVEDYGLSFSIWLDPQYLSEKAFKTINLPSSYVIDRNGTIRLMWIGAISKRALENYVSPIVKE
jgi:thiol-disulfide isomerase/thioredoxin